MNTSITLFRELRFFFVSVLFWLLLPSMHGQGILWQNTIGGSGSDSFSALAYTADGGCILGGHSNSSISGDKTENSLGDYDYWIVKLDASGNIEWDKTIGGSGRDWLFDVEQTSDGGYILGGRSTSGISGDKTEANIGNFDYWIIKLDASGSIMWQNTIGGSGADFFTTLWETSDGGYMLGGTSNSLLSGDKTENRIGGYDYWVLRLDGSGNILWQNTIGGTQDEFLGHVQETSDGGYILGGYSRSGITGDKTEASRGGYDYWIVKLDASGGISWQKTIGGSGDDYFFSVLPTADGGYFISGYSPSPVSGDKTEPSKGGSDYWLIKVDGSGSILWQKVFGGSSNDYPTWGEQTPDGGFIVIGASSSPVSGDKVDPSEGGYDYWVLKLDATGNISWQNTIGGSLSDQPYSLAQTAEGEFLVGGDSNSPLSGEKTEESQGSYDYWVMKLANITFAITSIPENCPNASDGQIEVFDVSGGPAPFMYSIDNGATYQSDPVFSGLPGGTYQVVVKDAGDNVSAAIEATISAGADAEAPVVHTCPAGITLSAGANCEATLSYPVPTFNDNCDGEAIPGTHISGPLSGEVLSLSGSPYAVVYQYTDLAGNGTAICSFTVTVEDDTPPVITGCPEDFSVECGFVVPDYAELFDIEENCGGEMEGMFSAGLNHILLIKEDGALWAWGQNNYGQLGDGTNINRNSPVQIGTDTDWKAIAAGVFHSLAIKEDGTLWAWGRNDYGQLGDGTNTSKFNPVQIGTGNDWSAVAVGTQHSVALKEDGTLWAWGWNNFGQLGDGTNTDKNSPVQVGVQNNWVALATRYYHVVALKSNGTLWAWGQNNYGQLGDGTNSDRNSPVQVGTATNWVDVSAGTYHSMGLKGDGRIWAWGWNGFGQLGDGTGVNKNTPVQIGVDDDWILVHAGGWHTMGLKSNGTLWTWGANNFGQLGDGTYINKYSPIQVGSETDWVAHGGAGYSSIGIRSDGTLWSWGGNFYGQLGNGTNTNTNTPILINSIQLEVSGGVETIQSPPLGAILGIGTHPITLTATDLAGNSSVCSFTITVEDLTPPAITCPENLMVEACEYEVPDFTDETVVEDNCGFPSSKVLTGGYYHSCAIMEDGTLWAWGHNNYGQLGNGTNNSSNILIQVGSDNDWVAVSAGLYHNLAIKQDGTLWAWGYNNEGQLGNGTNSNTNSPIQVGFSSEWVAVTAGGFYSLGLKSDGTLWAWGQNNYGQLGDGTNINKNTPVQVGNETNWSFISGGTYHTLSLKTDGTLWVWGLNLQGQLGDGTNVDKSIPTQIENSSSWIKISAGGDFSFGIKADGTLWAWGNNYIGQLGDGTTIGKNAPIQIGSETDWVYVDGGSSHSLGIRGDGSLWAWGYNFYGQLGDGTQISRSSPVHIGTLDTWNALAATVSHSLGGMVNRSLWTWGQNSGGQLGDGSNTNKYNPIQVLNFELPGGPGGVTLSQSPPPATILTPGAHTITLTATDASGNSSTCSFIVTIQGNTALTITCPVDVTIECDESTDPAVNTELGEATATDNCGTELMASQIGYSDLEELTGCGGYTGAITRTWTATDDNGNSTNCDQIITIVDTTPPAMICPADVTIECDESTLWTNTGIGTVSDNCTPAGLVARFNTEVQTPGSCPQEYTIARTWWAMDQCNNESATCTQIITVEDTTTPAMNCPADVTIECDESTLWTNTGIGTVSDNCTPTGLVARFNTEVQTPGSCPQEYTIARTWWAMDQCNNESATCTQIITVEDSTPPTITCPADVTIECNESTDPAVNLELGEATASDNCDPDVTTAQISYADVDELTGCGGYTGTITRTWIATDDCGNASDCDQIITIVDIQIPVITLTGLPLMSICHNMNYIDPGATATDLCGGDISMNIITDIPAGLSDGIPGTYTVTYDVADACGNNAVQVTRTVTVEPPLTASATAQQSMFCSGGSAVVDVSAIALNSPAQFNWSASYGAVTGGAGAGTSISFGTGAINDGLLYNVTNADVVVTYTITPYTFGSNQTDDNGGGDDCIGTPDQVQLIVKPEPLGANQALGICSGYALNVNLQTILNTYGNGLPSAFTWSAAANGDVTGETTDPVTGNSIDDLLTLADPENGPKYVVYTVTPTGLNGCTGQPFTVTVEVAACEVTILDPCSCLDNATTLANGQFSETVEITGPAGDTWWVVAAPGLYQSASPEPPAPPLPVSPGALFIEDEPGVYHLDARHVDASGYTITVTNGTAELSIGNTCYYPDPEISGLNALYCSKETLEASVTAQLGDGSGPASLENALFELIRQSDMILVGSQSSPAGTCSFSLNGLEGGAYILRVSFNGGDDGTGHPGCVQMVEESFTVKALNCGIFPWTGVE